MGKTAPPAAMRHQTPITQVTAAQAIAVLIAVTADIVGTVHRMSVLLQGTTEMVKPAPPVPINLPTPITRVTAAQAIAALTAGTADIVGTGLLMWHYLTAITEAVKTAQPVPMPPVILTIQVTAAPATAVLTAVTMVIVIVAAATPILLRDIIEAAKTA